MRTKLVLMLAFVCGAVIASGCGGDDSRSRGYVDPYRAETGGGSSATAAPTGGGSSSVARGGPSKTPVGDETGGGEYAPRKYTGSGQGGLGGEVSKADMDEWSGVGRSFGEAKKLYMQYFASKESSGAVDNATLDRAISMYEQLLPRAEALFNKYQGNPGVEQQYMDIGQDLRALKDEQN